MWSALNWIQQVSIEPSSKNHQKKIAEQIDFTHTEDNVDGKCRPRVWMKKKSVINAIRHVTHVSLPWTHFRGGYRTTSIGAREQHRPVYMFIHILIISLHFISFLLFFFCFSLFVHYLIVVWHFFLLSALWVSPFYIHCSHMCLFLNVSLNGAPVSWSI